MTASAFPDPQSPLLCPSIPSPASRSRPRSSRTSPASSRRITRRGPTPTIRRSASRSARPATAARRSTGASPRRTSSPSRRRSASTGRREGMDGPLFVGIDTHALSEAAWGSALEVLAANGVETMIQAGRGYTPTPVVSHAILTLQRRPDERPRRRGRPHAEPQPARGRRLQVQPADGRPRRHRRHADRSRTAPTSSSAPGSTACGGCRSHEPCKADTTHEHDFVRPYVDDLAERARPRRRRAMPASASAPTRWAARASDYWEPIAETLRARPRGRESLRGPDVLVHARRQRRQDPDGLLLALRDGGARRAEGPLRHRLRQRPRLRPPRHRHAERPG